MPFQSEKQRRYLWANEPEIARDWADTYGSRIQNNTGGISRLGFANGPNYKVDPNTVNQALLEDATSDYQGEEEEENPLQKFMRYMQGNAGNLSQGDVTANTNFLRNNNVRFAQNNPYQMYNPGGPFHGMNAPGSSAFGSKTPQEMAAKWMKKFGGVDHKTQKMIDKKAQISKIAQGNQGNNTGGGYQHPGSKTSIATAGDPMATGGIMRLGYAQGNPHQDPQDVQGPAHLSHNAPVDRGPAHLSHNAPSGGGGGDGKGITSQIGPTLDKGANILQNILPFMNPKKANMFGLGLNIFNTLRNKNNVSQEDMIYGVGDQSNLENQTDDNQKVAEVTKQNLRQLKALGIFTPGKKSAYTLGDVTGSNPIVPGMEKINKDEWIDILQGTYTT